MLRYSRRHRVAALWSIAPYSTTSSQFPRPFKLHIGTSFAGKPPDAEIIRARKQGRFSDTSPVGQWRNSMLAMSKAAQKLSHDSGQDFFFVQEMRNNSGASFGVADGVGGWVSYGVDPSLFSQALMFHAARYAKQGWAGEPESEPHADLYSSPVEGWELTPKHCLELAYQAVLREHTVNSGSSTACILSINQRTGLMRAANLGDSGFMIFRGTSLFYLQQPQTHSFNFPWQLSKINGKPQDDRSDYPSDAQEFSTTVRGGDIIVAFTDGLSDNVFPSEVLSICSLIRRTDASEDHQAQEMADRIVMYALTCMHSSHKISPFEKAALKHGLYYRGGKVDDVTAVVAIVTEDA